jgi:hypothetical protein
LTFIIITYHSITSPDRRTSHLYTFNTVDDLDELYFLDGSLELRNVWSDRAHACTAKAAIDRMHTILESDQQWQGYADYFKLTYAERLKRPLGDRQRFF